MAPKLRLANLRPEDRMFFFGERGRASQERGPCEVGRAGRVGEISF